MDRSWIALPLAALVCTALVLGVGYHYADQTHHRKPPATPTPDTRWPGTTVVRGTLTRYSQSVMSIRTDAGAYAIIFAQSTLVLPSCGRRPILTPGEALEVRVPVGGNGTLMATTVQLAGPCPT